MRGLAPCRHCGGDRDTCERCGYMTCKCSPCPCVTGVGSQRAKEAQAFYDAHGSSRAEHARRQVEEALQTGELPWDPDHPQ